MLRTSLELNVDDERDFDCPIALRLHRKLAFLRVSYPFCFYE